MNYVEKPANPKFGFSHYEKYEDTLDFLAWLKTPKNPTFGGNSSNRGGDTKWFGGTANMTEALKLAEFGWPEAPKLDAKGAGGIGLLDSFSAEGAIEMDYSVSGGVVDVGLYLSGIPECMMEFQETPARHARRIGLELYANAGVGSDAMERRGAVITALCEAITRSNDSIEVVLILRWNTNSGSHCCAEVTVKRATEIMSPQHLAFWCCNTAVFRRFGFSWLEHLPTRFNHGSEGHYGYQNCNSLPKAYSDQFDLIMQGHPSSMREAERQFHEALAAINAR